MALEWGTFRKAALEFTQEEWNIWGSALRELYWDVMMENSNLVLLEWRRVNGTKHSWDMTMRERWRNMIHKGELEMEERTQCNTGTSLLAI
ncbi:zinc finger protein 331-like [Lagenorhynchus albirostris]|uniref:zinc finger protein 331-like n=1 Tax=Lagenorhynchus albirostris TaxID=27610 RepID=UPI0028EFA756|nr:zinc finger protein 331-like [Lagenorhynchus albirostris]